MWKCKEYISTLEVKRPQIEAKSTLFKLDLQGTILTKFHFDICKTHRAEVHDVHLPTEAVDGGHLFKVACCNPEQSSQPMGPFLCRSVRNIYRPWRLNGLRSRPKPLYSKVDTQGTIHTKFHFDICKTHRAEVHHVHLPSEAVDGGHLFKVTSCNPEQSSQPMGPFLCSRVRNLY